MKLNELCHFCCHYLYEHYKYTCGTFYHFWPLDSAYLHNFVNYYKQNNLVYENMTKKKKTRKNHSNAYKILTRTNGATLRQRYATSYFRLHSAQASPKQKIVRCRKIIMFNNKKAMLKQHCTLLHKSCGCKIFVPITLQCLTAIKQR